MGIERVKILFLFLLLAIISGCTTVVKIHYEIPPDWKADSTRSKTIEKYSQYLRGRKFFLDPGHGGNDRKNKGRLGLVTEADVNLRVALDLRDYLESAGSIVYLSRDKDTTVNLKDRSIISNKSDADVFISIHHNATASANDNWTNYTSTYYHAKETDFEFEPCNHDLAKYVERDLSYVMDNPGGLGSFDGTYSDYAIYPGQGFSVLRLSEKPAILIECGFFTNNSEEQRLSIDEFNKIEAWGIFRGLAKYFKASIPQIIPKFGDTSKYFNQGANLKLQLQDISGINPKSIVVYCDTFQTYFNFDKNVLTVPLEYLSSGEHSIRIICSNNNENHSFPFRRKIIISNSLKAYDH
jgi:N-acetylmuramoyl-L-alanine amidase